MDSCESDCCLCCVQEPNPILRPLEVVGSLLGQLYYPVEHLAWLRDKEVLPGSSGLLWLLGLALWAGTLANDIIKLVLPSSF